MCSCARVAVYGVGRHPAPPPHPLLMPTKGAPPHPLLMLTKGPRPHPLLMPTKGHR